MAKKRADGRYSKSFMYKTKRYTVYGHTQKECEKNYYNKIIELKKNYDSRKNPTISEYYERWIEIRKDSIKVQTLRGQIMALKKISEIYIPSLDMTFGEIKIKELTINDLKLYRLSCEKVVAPEL